MKIPKIIGIGLNKTGTTTLGSCFELLGYRHMSYSVGARILYDQSEISALLKIMKYFDSFEDWPWHMLYKEAYKAFPDGKFILTTRADSEIWFKSWQGHVRKKILTRGKNHRIDKHRLIFWDWKDKDLQIKRYEDHNAEIRKFFADKPGSLLEVCWERGDGWKELADFLNIEKPQYPFPHANKRLSLAGRVLLRAEKWSLGHINKTASK